MRTRSINAGLAAGVTFALCVVAVQSRNSQAHAATAPAARAIAGPFAGPGRRIVCASDIRSAYAGEFSPSIQPAAKLVLSIAQAGGYALVGWEFGEEGGMSLFGRRAGGWCRLVSGGGAFSERDVVGVDGIDARTAHALFTARPTRSDARAR